MFFFIGSDSMPILMSDLSDPLGSQEQDKPPIEFDDLLFYFGNLFG
jgi:hypothetical protein